MGERVAASHKTHQQPCSVPWQCQPPFPGGCKFSLGNATQAACDGSSSPLIHTVSKWPHKFYQYLIANFSEKASQSGELSTHPSFPPDGLKWCHSGKFGGTPLISQAQKFFRVSVIQIQHMTVKSTDHSAEAPLSLFLLCIHKKNIFIIFPTILLPYLSKILWILLRTWPAVFSPVSLLTITSFSVRIQQDTLHQCPFQWLPNNAH